MRPERDEQERGDDGDQGEQDRLQNGAEQKADHARDRTRYDDAASDQRGDRKVDGEPGNHGDKKDRENAQRPALGVLQRRRRPGASTAIAGGRIDSRTISPTLDTSAATNQIAVAASVTLRPCNVPRKSSGNPARISNANSQPKNFRNAGSPSGTA